MRFQTERPGESYRMPRLDQKPLSSLCKHNDNGIHDIVWNSVFAIFFILLLRFHVLFLFLFHSYEVIEYIEKKEGAF